MRYNKFLILLKILLLLTLVVGCSDDKDGDDDETEISQHNTRESHRAGQACLNCHNVGGSNEYQFRLAGTVYDLTETAIYPNATIYLYTGPNATGTLVATVEVDALGNFYTTESIAWGGSGLHPVVESTVGTRFMVTATSDANCNDCHDGVSVSRIFVD